MNVLHIVSIFCFALCLVMFFYLKWYIKKRTSFAAGLEDRHEEVLKLIAEIDRITDRDSQLVEERIKRLKEILEEADSRIALYVKEFEKRQTGETIYSSLGRGIRAALDTVPAVISAPAALPAPAAGSAPAARIEIQDTIELTEAASSQRSIELDAYRAAGKASQKNQAQGPRENLQQPLNFQSAPAPESPSAAVQKISKKQIRTHIDILSGEGRSAEEIASLLGISIAEVNLALNLQRSLPRKN